MRENNFMAISRHLDELIRSSDDPRPKLADLVREHGPERMAREARIVFGSWRSRIDLVEQALHEILTEHGRGDHS